MSVRHQYLTCIEGSRCDLDFTTVIEFDYNLSITIREDSAERHDGAATWRMGLRAIRKPQPVATARKEHGQAGRRDGSAPAVGSGETMAGTAEQCAGAQ